MNIRRYIYDPFIPTMSVTSFHTHTQSLLDLVLGTDSVGVGDRTWQSRISHWLKEDYNKHFEEEIESTIEFFWVFLLKISCYTLHKDTHLGEAIVSLVFIATFSGQVVM